MKFRRRTIALAIATIGIGLPAVAYSRPGSRTVEYSELSMSASLSSRKLTLRKGDEVIGTYDVAVGKDGHETPKGRYTVSKVVWNPAWVPPDEKWAANKTPKAPGHPKNPMKMVKIFFKEPDYYIHGTGATESLGSAASHGCLRMDPEQAAEVGLQVMESGGVYRGWDWVKSILHMGEQRTVVVQRPSVLTITD